MVITPNEFRKRWGEQLIQFNENEISEIPLSENDRFFLLEAGFPKDAAPFLSFNEFKRGLRRIYEIWGHPTDYSDEERCRLKQYLVIGSDSAGNPIAIDSLNKCRVVHLENDDWFNTITFVNSGIAQLSVFLLLTKEMINKAHSDLARKELEEAISQPYKDEAFDIMEKVDSEAMTDGGFWKSEVGAL